MAASTATALTKNAARTLQVTGEVSLDRHCESLEQDVFARLIDHLLAALFEKSRAPLPAKLNALMDQVFNVERRR